MMIRKIFEAACTDYLNEIHSPNYRENRCAAICRRVEGWARLLEQAGQLTEADNRRLYNLHTAFERRSQVGH